MTEHLQEWKLAACAVTAGLTAFWGWFGWLVLLWVGCLLLDYLTGSMAAAKEKAWSSQVAREGIWHKAGCIAAVAVAALGDLLLGTVVENIPALGWSHSALLCPLVLVWYTLTELGSITENAVRLGASVPGFLLRALKLAQQTVEESDRAEKSEAKDDHEKS